jgi:hypothetical protein
MESEMKKFLLALSLATLTAGFAGTSYAQFYERGCMDNNSKRCVDARNAFAEHHNGVMPGQYYNHWYEGNQGRWYKQNNDWRWEGINGDSYWRSHRGWEWRHHHHHE